MTTPTDILKENERQSKEMPRPLGAREVCKQLDGTWLARCETCLVNSSWQPNKDFYCYNTQGCASA
jgi:hypothetical protein